MLPNSNSSTRTDAGETGSSTSPGVQTGSGGSSGAGGTEEEGGANLESQGPGSSGTSTSDVVVSDPLQFLLS